MGALCLLRKDSGAVALRGDDEKLEVATISIHGPPRDDQPHHFGFRWAIDARMSPGTICLDCAHSLDCLPGRARVARDPGSRPRNWALGSPPCRTAADATPALRAVALRPGRQDHGSVTVKLSAVALRRHDEKLEHATISIHSPPKRRSASSLLVPVCNRRQADARRHLLGLCTLPRLPSRASASSAETRDHVQGIGHSDRHRAGPLPTRPRLSALSRCGRGGKIMGRWPSNLAVFRPRFESVETFALARTSPVTSFPRRREPSQVSEKTGLAMTTRLRQLSRSPVANDSLRLVWVPACAGMTDGGGGMGALHLDRKDSGAAAQL